MVLSLDQASESSGNLRAACELHPRAQSWYLGGSSWVFLLSFLGPGLVARLPAPGQEPRTVLMKSESGGGLGGGMGLLCDPLWL